MKKLFMLTTTLLCILLGSTAVFASGDYSGVILYGDMNNDRVVDTTDYNMLVSWCSDPNPDGNSAPLDTRTLLAVDLNDDARATFHDSIILNNYLTNNDTSLKRKVAAGYNNGFEWYLYEKDCCYVDDIKQSGYCLIINEWNFNYEETPEWASIADKIDTVWFFWDANLIDKNIFVNATSLKTINVKSDNIYMTAESNILYNLDKTELIACPVTKSGNFTVKNGVNTISDYAFCNTGITALEIPESVTSIGNSAISECPNLTDIYYEGTKEEWQAVEVGLNNNGITNARIHFNYSKPSTSYKKNTANNTLSLTVTLPDKSFADGTAVIGAVYNGTLLKDIKIEYVTNGTVPEIVLSSAGVNTAKIYVWENMRNLFPTTYTDTIEIQ